MPNTDRGFFRNAWDPIKDWQLFRLGHGKGTYVSNENRDMRAASEKHAEFLQKLKDEGRLDEYNKTKLVPQQPYDERTDPSPLAQRKRNLKKLLAEVGHGDIDVDELTKLHGGSNEDRDIQQEALSKLEWFAQEKAREMGGTSPPLVNSPTDRYSQLTGPGGVYSETAPAPRRTTHVPRVLSPTPESEAAKDEMGPPPEDGVDESSYPPTTYELETARRMGILTPEQEQQVKADWAKRLTEGYDDTKQRRRADGWAMAMRALVEPSAHGKYAAPAAQAALSTIEAGHGMTTDRLDRERDAFRHRLNELQQGLSYDQQYALNDPKRNYSQLKINGKPITEQEFELLMQYAGPELGPQLAGQITGNDPNVVGAMAKRYQAGAGAGDARAALQRAQAMKAQADAMAVIAKEAREQGMAPLEVQKLEMQVEKMRAEAAQIEMQTKAIEDFLS